MSYWVDRNVTFHPEQYRRLKVRARAKGQTVSMTLRGILDDYYEMEDKYANEPSLE